MLDKTKYDSNFKVLKDVLKKSFTEERSGVFSYLNYDGKRLQYGPEDHGGLEGAHLIQIVRRDVDKMLVVKQTDKHYDYDPPTYYALPVNLNNAAGKRDYAVELDIKNCYWKTAYNLKLISDRTYSKGLRKDSWKIGRNAAIGALDKRSVRTEYVNGKELYAERYYLPRHYRYARQMVINTIDDIAHHVISKICQPDEFLMFVVDCFYVKASAMKKVVKYLDDIGYGSVKAGAFIRNHDDRSRMVCWDRIESIKLSDGQKFMLEEKGKFIHYTKRGIIE